MLVDGPGDLYTKSLGRELALAASLAGCTFPGRPLVEATGDLRNFTVQAKNAGCSLRRPTAWQRQTLWTGCAPLPRPGISAHGCWYSTPPAAPPPTP